MTQTVATKPSVLLDPGFLARFDQLDVMSRKLLAGKLKGERRSKRRGQSVEFADYRNYVVGDDLGYIGLVNYNRVNVIAMADGIVAETGPTRGRRRVAQLLDFVSKLKPTGAS